VAGLELDPECGIRQGLDNLAFELNRFFFRHAPYRVTETARIVQKPGP
jgi:hypothetical protein